MIPWSPIEQAIYNWLVPAYIPSAIFANQRVPCPAFPYASLLMTASAQEGGRDENYATTDLTRAKSVRITPTVANNTLYTITIGGHAYSYTSDSAATAAEITAGLKAAMSAATQTVTDNNGTIDVSSATLFLISVTANLSWANLDAGHEVVMTSMGSRRFVYQVSFHADETTFSSGSAYERAESARSSLSTESVVQTLLVSGIAVVKSSDVRDISMAINGQWVSRATFDAVLRTVVQPIEDTGYIASIVATGTVDGNTVPVVAP